MLLARTAASHAWFLACARVYVVREDERNEHVVNYMVCTPTPFFVESKVTQTERQTSANMGKDIVRIATNIPASRHRVNAIVTDNASAATGAAKEAAHEIIKTWGLSPEQLKTTNVWVIGCAAHMQQLLLLDIFKAEPASSILTKAARLTSAVNDSYLLGSAFRQHGGHVTTPVITRWGTQVDCLRSVLDSRAAFGHAATTYRLGGSEIPADVQGILEDDTFWAQAIFLVDFLAPVQKGGKDLQADTSFLGTIFPVYARMQEAMQTSIQAINRAGAHRKVSKAFTDAVDKALQARFADVTSPLHFFAHVIDPETAAKQTYVTRVPKPEQDRFVDTNIRLVAVPMRSIAQLGPTSERALESAGPIPRKQPAQGCSDDRARRVGGLPRSGASLQPGHCVGPGLQRSNGRRRMVAGLLFGNCADPGWTRHSCAIGPGVVCIGRAPVLHIRTDPLRFPESPGS